jgi:hypothetical protein
MRVGKREFAFMTVFSTLMSWRKENKSLVNWILPVTVNEQKLSLTLIKI